MSRAMNAIKTIVNDTYIKMTSGNYDESMFDSFVNNVGKATVSLEELSQNYRNEENRSGVLRAEVMKIALKEASDMVSSTKNISSSGNDGGVNQIRTDDQSRMFLDSLQNKLENLVIVSEFEDPQVAELKEFMIDAQKIYSEKGDVFQNRIESMINNTIGEHFAGDQVFNVCSELFECTNECSSVFISEHLTQEQVATRTPYKEPVQDNNLMKEQITSADMGRVREEFNRHAKNKGWNDNLSFA